MKNVYNVVGYEKRLNIRFTKEQIKLINKIIRKDNETYDSKSHFFRCAVIKLINYEKARLKL